MNCDLARETILTDHADGELDPITADLVAKHLAGCASCRALADALKKAARDPFARSGAPGAVPAHVWKKIEREIRASGAASEAAPRRFFPRVAWPKPVFIAATLATLVAALAVFARIDYLERRDLGSYVAEQMLSLAAVGDDAAADEDLYGYPGAGDGQYSRRGNFRARDVV